MTMIATTETNKQPTNRYYDFCIWYHESFDIDSNNIYTALSVY